MCWIRCLNVFAALGKASAVAVNCGTAVPQDNRRNESSKMQETMKMRSNKAQIRQICVCPLNVIMERVYSPSIQSFFVRLGLKKNDVGLNHHLHYTTFTSWQHWQSHKICRSTEHFNLIDCFQQRVKSWS